MLIRTYCSLAQSWTTFFLYYYHGCLLSFKIDSWWSKYQLLLVTLVEQTISGVSPHLLLLRPLFPLGNCHPGGEPTPQLFDLSWGQGGGAIPDSLGGANGARRAAEVPKKKSEVLQPETVSKALRLRSKLWYALVIQSSSSLENVQSKWHIASLETKLSAMMGHVTTFESGPIRLNFDEEGVVLRQHLSPTKRSHQCGKFNASNALNWDCTGMCAKSHPLNV